jgi:hypothetical protein
MLRDLAGKVEADSEFTNNSWEKDIWEQNTIIINKSFCNRIK